MIDDFDKLKEDANDISSAFFQAKQSIKDAFSSLKDPDIQNAQKSISKSLERQIRYSEDLNRIDKKRLGTQKLSTDLSSKISQITAEQSNLLSKQSLIQSAIENTKSRIFDVEQKLAGAKGKRRKDLEIIRQSLLEENKSLVKGLEHTYNTLERTEELVENYEGIRDINNDILEKIREAEEVEKERLKVIDEQHEGYKKWGKVLGKIPLIGSHLEKTFGNVGEKVKELRKEGKKITFSEILDSAISLTAAFGFIMDQMMKINESIVSLQRDLNLSSEEAANLYDNMASAATASNDNAISVGKLLKAQMALGEETGIYNVRSQETLVTFSKLVDKIGLSTKAASSLEMMSKLTGANFEQQRKSTAAMGVNMLRANGINVKGSKIMEQVANTTGQVAANLGNNPISIAKAVAQAQILGTTLEGVAKIANDLLNFESSISKELEAELLIGRDLNLERARALSLAGDQAGLAKELTKQVGTYAEFMDYNVIQQNQLAQAFGMSSDEMADMLKMQQYQNLNAEQLRAIGEEELAQNMEKQTLQQNFNNLIEKLQTLFVNIANGPLGTIANAISSILESSTAVYTVFGGITTLITGRLMVGLTKMLGINIANALASMTSLSAKTLGIGIPIAIGAVAAGYSYLKGQANKATSINDGVIDPQGGMVVSGPKGSIQLNKQDSIIAGTDLFKNNNQPTQTAIQQPSMSPKEMTLAIQEGMRGLQIVQEGVPMGQVMSKNIALHGDIPSSIA